MPPAVIQLMFGITFSVIVASWLVIVLKMGERYTR